MAEATEATIQVFSKMLLDNEVTPEELGIIMETVISRRNYSSKLWFIRKTVETHYEVEDLNIKTRERPIVQSRQIAHYFSYVGTKVSIEEIGFRLGRKDHATVLNSAKTVWNLFLTDVRFREDLEKVSRLLDIPIIDPTNKRSEELYKRSKKQKPKVIA